MALLWGNEGRLLHRHSRMVTNPEDKAGPSAPLKTAPLRMKDPLWWRRKQEQKQRQKREQPQALRLPFGLPGPLRKTSARGASWFPILCAMRLRKRWGTELLCWGGMSKCGNKSWSSTPLQPRSLRDEIFLVRAEDEEDRFEQRSSGSPATPTTWRCLCGLNIGYMDHVVCGVECSGNGHILALILLRVVLIVKEVSG